MLERQCALLGTSFSISDEELKFLDRVSPIIDGKKYDISPSNFCPDARAQRRFAFRNFYNLYRRTSDLSGKTIVSMYDRGTPFPVYDIQEWWGDQWDALQFGQPIREDCPPWEQIRELSAKVPHMNIVNSQCENTDYCNFSYQSRNCYLVSGNIANESCCYGHIVWQSRDCLDCLYVYRSELCYDCVDCVGCYDVAFSVDAANCSDSRFLIHCSNCRNCFGCAGLVNKEYHLFNQRCTPTEYAEKIEAYDLGSWTTVQELKDKTRALLKDCPVKYYHGYGCENATGDYLYHSKNVFDCFDLKNCEDVRYGTTLESFVDCQDCSFSPNKTELSYNCIFTVGFNLICCHNALNNSSYLMYCDNCYSCSNCFGCVGLKNEEYCIYNTKYSKEEYNRLVPTLIERMRTDGNWGEFFPVFFSPFAYNETMAQEYFPLYKDDALTQGFGWKDKDPDEYRPTEFKLPDNIKDLPQDISSTLLSCEETGKNYKIISQEETFLRRQEFAAPRKCPDARHQERMAGRNPRKLWKRECAASGVEILTTYAPDRPEKVYSEESYLQEMY